MRLTIIKGDGFVSVDGVGFTKLDLSSLPANFHALQWYETYGNLEEKDANGVMSNVEITSLTPYQDAIDAWTAYNDMINNPPVIPPTAEENKALAESKLISTDWSQLPDVPISNQQAFADYRAIIRSYIITPVAGIIEWPVEPEPVWI